MPSTQHDAEKKLCRARLRDVVGQKSAVGAAYLWKLFQKKIQLRRSDIKNMPLLTELERFQKYCSRFACRRKGARRSRRFNVARQNHIEAG